jgi:hypothetical protein
MYEIGSMIAAGSDTITICYDVSASLIDNFCPYTVLSGSLSVEWCGIYAYYSDEHIQVRWLTCSNSGTKKFDILTSTDAQNWITISTVKPIQETSSTELDYNVCIPFHKSGMNYFAVREEDLNGNFKVSDIVYCDVPETASKSLPQYDLLGRSINSNSFMYYIGN